MEIGIRIKKLRDAKGYSQQFMAINLGITQSAYCKIEKNGNKMKIEQLVKIAAILEVDVSELIKQVDILG